MPDTNDKPKRYRYGLFWKFGAVFFAIMAAGAIGLVMSLLPAGRIGAAIGFLPMVTVPVFFCLAILLASAAIDVGDDGIAAYVLGRKTAFIHWRDVRRIKKNRPEIPRYSGYRNSFCIYDGDTDAGWFGKLMGNWRSPIQINDSIGDFSELCDRIEDYARHYGIPIIECDEVARDLMLQRRSGRPGAEHEKNPNSAWRKYERFPGSPDDPGSDRQVMHFVGHAPKHYRYRPSALFANWGILVMAVFLAGLAILAIISREFGYALFLSPLAIGSLLISLTGFLTLSPIGIDDEGIFACKLGLKLKSIRWQDVHKIKKLRFSAMGPYCTHAFHIYEGETTIFGMFLGNLRSPILFLDTIRNLEELLDTINAYARHYRIPLVVEDQGDVPDLAMRDGSVRRRLRSKAPEIRVTRI